MVKNEKIYVNISYRNITHYLKLGYNAILGEDLEISVFDLPTSSHVKIDVCCSLCYKESNIPYYKYVENRKRHGFYGCKKCSRQKAALTSIERYGVENYSMTEEYRERVENTNMEKYGYKTILLVPEHIEYTKMKMMERYNTDKFYEIRTKKDKFVLKKDVLEDLVNDEIRYSEDSYMDFVISDDCKLYRNECRRLTKRSIKVLLEEWDGLDYYDKSDISSNFDLEHNDPSYPTIDHKISIYQGYKNGIDPKYIGSVENICITKRSINSSKRDLSEKDFSEYLKSRG